MFPRSARTQNTRNKAKTPQLNIAILMLLIGSLTLPLAAARKPDRDAAAREESLPPKDARWTVYCQAIGGPDHVERANGAKADLMRTSGMKDWYVIHNDTESVIYYGFYRAFDDPKDKRESEGAQRDRAAIDKLDVFKQTLFVEITSPDPAAPAEWDLRNADGYWSLEIGVYKDSPQRKMAAVEAVRDARKQGITAYYYHGPTASSVCIGAWPREAFHDDMAEGGDVPTVVAPDAEHDVVVLPQPLDPSLQIRNRQGEQVTELTPRTKVNDPSLLAALTNYPTHAINGEVMVKTITDPVTKQVTKQPDPSLIVRIPAKTTSLLGAAGERQQPPPALLQPTSPSQTPGAGKLRSVGE